MNHPNGCCCAECLSKHDPSVLARPQGPTDGLTTPERLAKALSLARQVEKLIGNYHLSGPAGNLVMQLEDEVCDEENEAPEVCRCTYERTPDGCFRCHAVLDEHTPDVCRSRDGRLFLKADPCPGTTSESATASIRALEKVKEGLRVAGEPEGFALRHHKVVFWEEAMPSLLGRPAVTLRRTRLTPWVAFAKLSGVVAYHHGGERGVDALNGLVRLFEESDTDEDETKAAWLGLATRIARQVDDGGTVGPPITLGCLQCNDTGEAVSPGKLGAPCPNGCVPATLESTYNPAEQVRDFKEIAEEQTNLLIEIRDALKMSLTEVRDIKGRLP